MPALTEEEIKECVSEIKGKINDIIEDMPDERLLAPWYIDFQITLGSSTLTIEFGKGGPGSGGGGGCGPTGCN